MSQHAQPVSESGVDLEYRPTTYFWAEDLHIQLPCNIQGMMRKALYEECLRTGEEMPEALVQPRIPTHLRQALGRLHPQMMGGEYLPRPRRSEVVIARLTINSTTADTYAIYVKRSGQRLVYRAVDEYEGSSLGKKTTRSSRRPLCLRELVAFAMEAWAVCECLEGNFEMDGYPREECHDFLMEIDSSFYAEFELAMRFEVDQWLDKVAPDNRSEDDEEARSNPESP